MTCCLGIKSLHCKISIVIVLDKHLVSAKVSKFSRGIASIAFFPDRKVTVYPKILKLSKIFDAKSHLVIMQTMRVTVVIVTIDSQNSVF